MSKRNIGIDFGTTFSAIAYVDDIKGVDYFDNGKSTFPTIATFDEDKNLIFGKEVSIDNTISDKLFRGFKVLLSDRLDSRLKNMNYNKNLMPKDIAFGFLVHMLTKYKREENIDYLDNIVLTVPFIWMNNNVDSRNKRILIEQCRLAVNKVFGKGSSNTQIQLLAEPIAAALYCANQSVKAFPDLNSYKLLVVDYGGGTLDVSLCDISREDGLPKVSILGSPWGVGMNTEHEMGKAGMAFQQKVFYESFKSYFGEERELIKDTGYWLAISSLENALINGPNVNENIKQVFYSNPSENDLDKTFTQIRFYGNYNSRSEFHWLKITYRMLWNAFYSKEISGELNSILRNESKTGVIDYLEVNMNDYLKNPDFKIALVGGFCNFYLTQKEIYKAFNLVEQVGDSRIFTLSNRERESAVCFGAALKSSKSVILEIIAQYSLGIFTGKTFERIKESDRLLWAIRYGDKITAYQPNWIRIYNRQDNIYGTYPSAFVSTGVEFIAVHHFPRSNEAIALPINVDDVKQRLINLDDNNAYYNIGFSYDESEFIYIHSRKVKYNSEVNEYTSNEDDDLNIRTVFLGSIGDIQGMTNINEFKSIIEGAIENA